MLVGFQDTAKVVEEIHKDFGDVLIFWLTMQALLVMD